MTSIELLRYYNRFLCVVNDWYGSTERGMRQRSIKPNSYIGLHTHLPSLFSSEDGPDQLAFDIEYEFGIEIPVKSVGCMTSVQHLFLNLLNRTRQKEKFGLK